MITKIDAAEKQLETAIRLFFENRDRLSSYTLAAASREITDDLCDKQKSALFQAELERVGDPQKVSLSFRDQIEIMAKPEHLKEVIRRFKEPQNFLKHADKDANQELRDISVTELSFVIVFAIKNFILLEKRWSPAMAMFFCWFAAVNPRLFTMDELNGGDFVNAVAFIKRQHSDLNSRETFSAIYQALVIS